MSGGSFRAMTLETLPGWASELVATARVARLAYLDGDARPRVLPVTFAVGRRRDLERDRREAEAAAEPARVEYLRRRPEAALLVDEYDDDWSRLAWVQLLGRGGRPAPLGPRRDGRAGGEVRRLRAPPPTRAAAALSPSSGH